jgi:hypothetical protein
MYTKTRVHKFYKNLEASWKFSERGSGRDWGVKWSTFHTADPQILGTTLQNLVARDLFTPAQNMSFQFLMSCVKHWSNIGWGVSIDKKVRTCVYGSWCSWTPTRRPPASYSTCLVGSRSNVVLYLGSNHGWKHWTKLSVLLITYLCWLSFRYDTDGLRFVVFIQTKKVPILFESRWIIFHVLFSSCNTLSIWACVWAFRTL